jgi:predicted RNase H-like HicB family nuclease
MKTKSRRLTALIERDGDWFVATCPEVDVASQGRTIEQARKNLVEALDLFFSMASPSELKRRMKSEVYVTQIEVSI